MITGGLYLEKSNVTLKNMVVMDNQTEDTGPALYIEGGAPCLLHSTLVDNAGAAGPGIYVTDDGWGGYSHAFFTNTILSGYTLGFEVAANKRATLNTTLWGRQPSIYWHGEGVVERNNDVFGDVGLTDTYHITTESAALDAGVHAGVMNDIDGQPRPYQAPDLGADEFWPPGALKFVYLPLVRR